MPRFEAQERHCGRDKAPREGAGAELQCCGRFKKDGECPTAYRVLSVVELLNNSEDVQLFMV